MSSKPAPPQRTSRPPELIQRLERSRERERRRKDEVRERERVIRAAIKTYIAEWHAIIECEAQLDTEVTELRQRIRAAEERAGREKAEHHTLQAAAAARMRESGLTEVEISELLETSTKHVRQLLAAARAAHNGDAASSETSDNRTIDRTDPPNQQPDGRATDIGASSSRGDSGKLPSGRQGS
ncbi:hypothetical protein IU510_20580 [Nocardia cyriacigeorgica]|uniref:hypothetical protein n=1 Tax=Nocardia cyriacigeorgica TaxID=135487 RepID=UPI00189365D4|nr:hypothetical protein [Nocardia cyriacigeorgica]MBF6100458.1 hypothetical protein [Nocardia cyriacigeorgica]MBF6320292.1 hypothetical protein [Nocardia cyriacigeorgica]MBF6346332.1 hypothetical protein [Nocardia cyriacigeorgica]MBF6534222.1 hypothetical protein [Nocardia cyriacigeorgica]